MVGVVVVVPTPPRVVLAKALGGRLAAVVAVAAVAAVAAFVTVTIPVPVPAGPEAVVVVAEGSSAPHVLGFIWYE